LGFVSSLHHGIGDNHHLLGRCLESSDGLRLGAQRLDGVHQFQGLVNKGLAEFDGPGQFVAHFLNHRGEPGHGFHIFVPWLFIKCREVVGIRYKAGGLHNFHGIRRRRQHHREQRVRVERDRRNQLLQIGSAS
jgi:hypothetical protein